MDKGILLVDDALFMRATLRGILKSANYEIAGEAKDGGEALRMFRELKPILVLLDIVMPETQGLDVLKEMLTVDPSAKVLMISAMGQEGIVNEALESGAKGYIVKPFKAEEVVAEVRKILGGCEDKIPTAKSQ